MYTTMKKILSLFTLIILVQWTLAVDPSTNLQEYYASADGKSGEAIRSALSSKINEHTTVSYDNLKYLFKWTDTYNNAGEVIDDIYSACDPAYVESWCSGDCGYNREHSLPKSWFSEASVLYSDAFHLYPTNCYVNSFRGNWAFGECEGGEKCTTHGVNGKGRKGTSTFEYEGRNYASVGTVYEPDDEFKGDLARSYFYMVTCYINQNFTYADGGQDMFTYENNTAQLSQYSIDLLLKWHRQDPVSQRELVRNEVIYGNTTYNKCNYRQGNRNPFIDYPCLAEYIWGEHKGEVVNLSTLVSGYDAFGTDCCGSTTEPAITLPKGTVDCGATEINEPAQKEISLKGINLETGNLSLAISGTNAAYFTINTTSVSQAQALVGQPITITYTPEEEGDHSATLTVSGCGVTNHTVTLTGKCTATHTINWIDANASQTTKVATGDPLILPDNTPANCSEERVFMGWTAATSVTSEPSDLFTEASGIVTEPATYYAIYADKEVTGGGNPVANKATSISVGDKVVIVCEDVSKEMSGFSTTSTIYGMGTSYTNKPAGTLSFDVVAGKSSGTYAFLNGTDYLNWNSGNSLNTASSLSDNTSWTVTFDADGNAAIKNANDSSRRLLWNKSSPRFACYTQTPGSNYYNVQLYAITGGTTITYSNYSLSCGGATGIEHTPVEQVATKLLIDGQFYILRDGKLYTITGMQLR